MNRLLLQFLLFIFIISCFGCTITKRRYTGGYYVNWRHKTPDAREFPQPKMIPDVSNKIVQSKKPSIKTEVAAQTGKTNFRKVVQAISSTRKVSGIAKNNPIANSGISTYTITPENTVPGHQVHRRGRSPGLKGFINTMACLVLASIATILALSINNSVFLVGPLSFVAFILLIIGFIDDIRGLKHDDPNRDLAQIGLLIDIIILLAIFLSPLLL